MTDLTDKSIQFYLQKKQEIEKLKRAGKELAQKNATLAKERKKLEEMYQSKLVIMEKEIAVLHADDEVQAEAQVGTEGTKEGSQVQAQEVSEEQEASADRHEKTELAGAELVSEDPKKQDKFGFSREEREEIAQIKDKIAGGRQDFLSKADTLKSGSNDVLQSIKAFSQQLKYSGKKLQQALNGLKSIQKQVDAVAADTPGNKSGSTTEKPEAAAGKPDSTPVQSKLSKAPDAKTQMEAWNLAPFTQLSNQLAQIANVAEPIVNSNEPIIQEKSKENNKNYKTALLCTIALAETQAFAMNNLGIYYYKGLGTERNFEKAVECFETAAAMGHKVAEFNLGFCYERGEGVEKNLKKAFEQFNKADSADFHLAKVHLAFYYALGLGGIKQNLEKSRELLNNTILKLQHSLALNSTNISYTLLWAEDKNHNVSINIKDKSIASYSLVDLRYFTIFAAEDNSFCIAYNNLPPIYKAAFEGDLKAFDECVKAGYKIDVSEKLPKTSPLTSFEYVPILQLANGITPLIMAVLGNSREMIKRLYELGCDPLKGWYDDPNVGKLSTVHLATLPGNNLTLNTLCSKKIDLNQNQFKSKFYGLTPLICAVMGGDDGECAKILLSMNDDINATNQKGHTALMEAMINRNHAMVQFLCDNGANLSLQTRTVDANSALSLGCWRDNIDGVEIMTSFERCTFPLSHENNTMISPLGIAIERNNVKMVETILKSKAFRAKPDLVARYERSPTFLNNSLPGFEKMVRTALPSSAVLSEVNALEYAVALGRTEIVKLLMTLIPKNVSAALRPKFSKDCLTIAVEKGYEDIVKLLLEKEFDINEQDDNGRTWLHKLIEANPNENTLGIANFFLKSNIDYTRKDDQGFTPLILCLKKIAEIEALRNKPTESEDFFEQVKKQHKRLDDPLLFRILILKFIASDIIMTIMFRHLDKLLEIKKIKLENFNLKKCTPLIDGVRSKFRYCLSLSGLLAHSDLVIPTHKFDDSVLPRSIRRMLPKYIRITDAVLKRIVDDIIEKAQLGYNKEITTQSFFELIWNCCNEKLALEKKGLEKKIQEEQRALTLALKAVESDLLWMPGKVTKYLDEFLKLSKSRKAVNDVFENIKALSKDPMIDSKFGTAKLQAAEALVTEISGLSEKLLQQQISFSSAYQKLQPKIKACLAKMDLKQAKKLISHLHKISSKIENLGASFKQVFRNLNDVEETLTDQLSHERARRILLQKRQEEKANKEKSYLQNCMEQLLNAEQRLQELQEAVRDRMHAEAGRRVQFQLQSVKQKQQKTESVLAQKEMKQAKEREADKMVSFASRNAQGKGSAALNENTSRGNVNPDFEANSASDYRRKATRPVKLGQYLVQPQLKLKAREELNKLTELLQTLTFGDFTTLGLSEDIYIDAESFAKMQRFAIMGIVARAMECYKNIRVNHQGVNSAKAKDGNIFKEYARIFRNAAFHCLDEKLFRKISDDSKKNAEVNQPFIDMACKMLAFLNDPKWQKQGITKEDIVQAFAGKSPDNDLFTKILKLGIKAPTAQECKDQILQGRRDLREFEGLKDQVTDLFYQAAIGFCYARIGCFASELTKHKNSTPEERLYRAVFNELRRVYHIPLGKYIGLGVGFRHILALSRETQAVGNTEALIEDRETPAVRGMENPGNGDMEIIDVQLKKRLTRV